MFTYEEAGQLLQKIFKEIFEAGNVSLVKEVYAPNFVGHYNNVTFDYNAVEQRVAKLNKSCSDKIRLEVEEYYISGDYIIFKTRQTWLSPRNNRLCESIVFGNYRIENKKIAELWLITDSSLHSYDEMNESIEDMLSEFELNTYGKKSFFKYLSDYEYFYQQDKINLTEQEQEILFYSLRGLTAKEVSAEMGISHRTVETYLGRIMDKYGCNSKQQLRLKLFPESK